jgi:hypothetical protein
MKKFIRIIMVLFIASYIPLSYAHAVTPWEGSPLAVQGSIMAVGQNYIIVAEKMVVIADTVIDGMKVKTIITDSRGGDLDKGDLKKGTIVFAKCYVNDDIQKDGFVAAEIHIVPHILGAEDAKKYNKLMTPEQP